ncbi:MAG: IPT/TIG domain-containing protein, partial [Candidatus Methylomirabilales bacterium]
ADPGVKAALDSLGRSFDFWDAAELGPPFARDELSYSTVVWLGGWFPDLAIDAIQPYLELGGNLLVSGELFGTWDRAAYSFFPPSTFHRDFLHGTGIFVVDYFDKNHQNYPVSVAGAPGELFEGLTFDINSYNLNSTGETTAIFTDELLVSPTDGASPLFTYPYGLHTPAVAGLKVDTGTFRVVYTGFGIEAINDTGEATLSHLFSKVFDSFNPAPEISSVLPRALPTEGGEFQVVGKNFQPTGTTRVLVDRVEVRADVSSRTSLAATLPPGLAPGSYTVTVINPFGHEAVAEGALTIEAAATPPATAP